MSEDTLNSLSKRRAQRVAELCAALMMKRDEASRHFGMDLIDVGAGYARMRMTVKDWMLNGNGNCHGGMIFSVADSTFGVACNSYNKLVVAQVGGVTFVAPVHLGDELLTEGREVVRYGRSGIYDITVHNQNGALVAEFRGHSRQLQSDHFENIEELLEREGLGKTEGTDDA
ncbi:MAG: hydroxyphenylacetyl-CoA thioesterase PaaI [Pseudomonadota bacterium]